MPISDRNSEAIPEPPLPDDSGSSVLRHTVATMGLILIGTGSVLALWLFYQVAQLIVDPRPYSEVVGRWEFVIRGRQLHNDVSATEAPDRRRAGAANRGDQSEELAPEEDLSHGVRDVETAARLAGRVGSQAARPAAVMAILFLTLILIRIATALIESGAKLIGVLSGERELMEKLLRALNRNR